MVQYGVGYADAKDIAMTVFRENFSKLSKEAHRVAFERAEEFTANYLSELHNREPKAIANLEDPGVQSDILEAQSGFAKSGHRDLGEILVDILVDRTARTERSTASLTLSAALSTAQKLTSPHFAALSSLFALKQLRAVGATRPDQIYAHFSNYLSPMRDDMKALSSSDVQYLAGLGCLTISIGSNPVHATLQTTYPGLFCAGMDISSAPSDLSGSAEDGPESVARRFKDTPAIMRTLRDPSKFQVAAVDKEGLSALLARTGLTEYDDILQRTLTARPMDGDLIISEIREFSSSLGDVIDAYNIRDLPNCSNTAIGTAIGHANIRKVTSGAFTAALDVWIS
ncbi:LPO_1073/Vpar_1526 family protein [Streptomyces chryseus]